MAILAGNLVRARDAIQKRYPGTVVYWIGDVIHQSEASDHNQDARGIVHAIDAMQPARSAAANGIVHAAVGRVDLEYVIHNRTIWSQTTGWKPVPYKGSNPHTDHVHMSGRHGTTGATSATGNGYSIWAEVNGDPWNFGNAPHTTLEEDSMWMYVPDGVAFNNDEGSTWFDPQRAVALAIPKVGVADTATGAWGPAWVWLAGNQKALVRLVYNGGGHWDGIDVPLEFADGGHVVPLPDGCTQLFVGYKSGSGATFMVKTGSGVVK
jgi:hypothetical protein